MGVYEPKDLKRKTNPDRIDLRMRDCFIKMETNGRDMFVPRLTVQMLQLEKAETHFH
jgi:hypothetical protein